MVASGLYIGDDLWEQEMNYAILEARMFDGPKTGAKFWTLKDVSELVPVQNFRGIVFNSTSISMEGNVEKINCTQNSRLVEMLSTDEGLKEI